MRQPLADVGRRSSAPMPGKRRNRRSGIHGKADPGTFPVSRLIGTYRALTVSNLKFGLLLEIVVEQIVDIGILGAHREEYEL